MNNDLVVSYLSLRKLIGVSGFMLPVLLFSAGLILPDVHLQPSISEYYYTHMRDVFVGNLFVIGTFLSTYKGHDSLDRSLSLVAGISAIGVAVFPTDISGYTWIGVIHYVSAGLFFASVGYYSLFVFTKGETYGVENVKKRRRNLVFSVCGVTIFSCLVALTLSAVAQNVFGLSLDRYCLTFILEAVAVWAFSLSWLVKGQVFYSDSST